MGKFDFVTFNQYRSKTTHNANIQFEYKKLIATKNRSMISTY